MVTVAGGGGAAELDGDGADGADVDDWAVDELEGESEPEEELVVDELVDAALLELRKPNTQIAAMTATISTAPAASSAISGDFSPPGRRCCEGALSANGAA